MGVVATTLKTIQADVDEFAAEADAKLAAVLAKDTLDQEDKEALEALRLRAVELKDIVPNAVTLPLPDPENTTDLNPTAEDVVAPGDVVADPETTEGDNATQ